MVWEADFGWALRHRPASRGPRRGSPTDNQSTEAVAGHYGPNPGTIPGWRFGASGQDQLLPVPGGSVKI